MQNRTPDIVSDCVRGPIMMTTRLTFRPCRKYQSIFYDFFWWPGRGAGCDKRSILL